MNNMNSTEELNRLNQTLTIYAPLNVKILLHYHLNGVGDKFQDSELIDSPAGSGVIKNFLDHDILFQRVGEGPAYGITEKGRAWVHAILSTPIPKQIFVDPRTGQEIENP